MGVTDGHVIVGGGHTTGFLKRWAIPNDYLSRPAAGAPMSVTTKETVSALASPSSARGLLLSGTQTGVLRLWDAQRMASSWEAAAKHEGPITGIAEHSERALIATASQDRTLKLWRWRD